MKESHGWEQGGNLDHEGTRGGRAGRPHGSEIYNCPLIAQLRPKAIGVLHANTRFLNFDITSSKQPVEEVRGDLR